MIRRRMLAALVLVAGAAGLTACAGNGAAASGAGDPQTLVVYSGGDTNVQQLWEQTLIPGFEKANPGVTVTPRSRCRTSPGRMRRTCSAST
jgi:putative spermidine/putrescine transport system substrate-binding protein